MLKKIAIAFAALIIVVVAIIALRPGEFTVQRSILISAPPATVLALIDDFHQWPKWSPWEKRDPTMKKEYGGAPSGAGATYQWTGTREVGKGRMTILDTVPNERVVINLEFIEPFPATNTTVFQITPKDGASELTWAMSGKNNFMGKAFSLVMNMDKMVGGDFESGLASLKQMAEAQAKTPPPAATAGN